MLELYTNNTISLSNLEARKAKQCVYQFAITIDQDDGKIHLWELKGDLRKIDDLEVTVHHFGTHANRIAAKQFMSDMMELLTAEDLHAIHIVYLAEGLFTHTLLRNIKDYFDNRTFTDAVNELGVPHCE